jgi:hypothetical protein
LNGGEHVQTHEQVCQPGQHPTDAPTLDLLLLLPLLLLMMMIDATLRCLRWVVQVLSGRVGVPCLQLDDCLGEQQPPVVLLLMLMGRGAL